MKINELKIFIFSANPIDLETFAFQNFKTFGLYIFQILLERYNKNKEIEIAILMSKLLSIEIYWEGKDLFEIYFYESVLVDHPNSSTIIESLLTFGLPPYNPNILQYYDFNMYKTKLHNINPNSYIFKKF